MTLPNYLESIQYYTDGKETYNCPLLYGFQCYNNQIRPAIIKKNEICELYKSFKLNLLYHTFYFFPNIPNESDYNKFLKDFLYKLKLDRINDDFS